jgi:lysine-specific demethylase/histidyl-hydroxylase NO66
MDYKALSKLVSCPDRFVASPPEQPTVWETQEAPLKELISLKLIDQMINGDLLASSRSWRFVKDGKRIPISQFVENGSGDVHPATVVQLLRDGATLALNDLEKYWQPTRDFCRRLTFETGIRVDAVAFFTPSEAAGFSFHPDWQSVLIAQVEGTKRWVLKPPVRDGVVGRTGLGGGKPGQFTPDDETTASLPTELEVTLHPGEVLWIPSGWLHSGKTEQDISLHLSFGFSSFDRGWLTRQLVEFFCTSETMTALHRLGKQLPWACVHESETLNQEVSQMISEFSTMLTQTAQNDLVEFIRAAMMKEFPRPHLNPTSAFTSGAEARIALNADSFISRERLPDGGLQVSLPPSVVTVHGKTADVLEAMSVENGHLDSLPIGADSLSDTVKQRLLSNGVLRIL